MKEKTCAYCKQTKDISEFKERTGKSSQEFFKRTGEKWYNCYCIPCDRFLTNERQKKCYRNNIKARLKYQKKYHEKNAEKEQAYAAEYRKRPEMKEKAKKYYQKRVAEGYYVKYNIKRRLLYQNNSKLLAS